MLLREGLLY